MSILFFLLTAVSASYAQVKPGVRTGSQVFYSPEDQELSIKNIVLAPVYDNVGGIYAKPLDEHLAQTLKNDSQWAYTPAASPISAAPTENFEENSEKVKKILSDAKASALLAAKVTRGPGGTAIKLALFSARDGKLLIQQELTGYQGFDLNDIKQQTSSLYNRIKQSLPYHGLVLSRKGTQVTLNVGSIDGVKVGEDLSIIQIVKVERHPRFNFIVHSEKEVIGRVRITKVDQALSFASILFEKEPMALSVNSKVLLNKPIVYENPIITPEDKIQSGLSKRSDTTVAFGDDAEEWTPQQPPSFGKFGLSFGLNSFSESTTLSSSGGIQAKTDFAPLMSLDLEIWINPQWYMYYAMGQGLANIKNPLSGSSPADLNFAQSFYQLGVGHNFLLTQNFFGPKFQVFGGLLNWSTSVSDSSPTAFTSISYSAISLGLRGLYPLPENLPWSVGAEMNLFFTPSASEAPVSSGGFSNHNLNKFGLFGVKKISQTLNFKVNLDFYSLDSRLSGSGTRVESASNITQSLRILHGGIEYLF